MLGSSILLPLSLKTDALPCPFGKEYFFILPSMQKKWPEVEETYRELATLAAPPAAMYPLVLGHLKTAFPARYRKAHTAVRMRAPSQRLPLGQVFSIRVDMQKRGMAVCLFSMYSYYTSKLTVNMHLHNERFCVEMPSLHGKCCGICTYKLGARLCSLND